MIPIIVLLDIDGTVVGDVSSQVAEWEILKCVAPKKIPLFKKHLIHALKRGLVRPYCADFLTGIKSKTEHVEFFFYTASEDQWAKVLVPCIEAAAGITVNRPILSRRHCLFRDGTIYKSFKQILPAVMPTLRKKYQGDDLTSKRLLENMMLIDNNKVLHENKSQLILCPTYDATVTTDMIKQIDEEILEANLQIVGNILIKYGMVNKHYKFNGIHGFLAQYYATLSQIFRIHESPVNDTFLADVTTFMLTGMKKKYEKEMLVKYINQKLSSQ